MHPFVNFSGPLQLKKEFPTKKLPPSPPKGILRLKSKEMMEEVSTFKCYLSFMINAQLCMSPFFTLMLSLMSFLTINTSVCIYTLLFVVKSPCFELEVTYISPYKVM